MRVSRRSSKKKSQKLKKASVLENTVLENTSKLEIAEIDFESYLGQTVTVFVNAGGAAGKGFTGILMGRSEAFIRLLVMPGAPPACSLGNSCGKTAGNELFCALCQFNANASMGSIVDIPMRNVVAFVHNAVRSGQF